MENKEPLYKQKSSLSLDIELINENKLKFKKNSGFVNELRETVNENKSGFVNKLKNLIEEYKN